MVPVLVAARFDELGWGLAMALGSLCVSLSDQAGPIHHRSNGMLATIALATLSSLLTGLALPYPWLMTLLLAFFGFGASIIGVFGSRAASVGTASLAALTLQLYEQELVWWQNSLLIMGGGLWYYALSMSLYRLRPYKLAQQLLADCMQHTAGYLRIKARFYGAQPAFDELYKELLQSQIAVHQKQDLAREVLFKTREIVKESTHTGRVLVMVFLDTVDLFETITTSQPDYKSIQQALGHTGILQQFEQVIVRQAEDIENLGMAIAENRGLQVPDTIKNDLIVLEEQFASLRHTYISGHTVEAFISLRHILNILHDIEQRLEMLHTYTTYDKKLKSRNQLNLQQFTVPSYINVKLLLGNLHYGSNLFRYAIRMTAALLSGYWLSLALPLGHSYWILLTIVVILKPAYALTRSRNRERLFGTVAGAVAGTLILWLSANYTFLFTIMLVAMAGAFSLMRTRYQLSVALLTVYVLLAFKILHPASRFDAVVQDRVIDTLIGSTMAFLFTFIFSPRWEKYQLPDLSLQTLMAVQRYFAAAVQPFLGNGITPGAYKLQRKATYVALADLSDTFQRMMNEPKARQENGTLYYQLVVSFHVLIAHIAALSQLSKTYRPENAYQDFQLFYQEADERMQAAVASRMQPDAHSATKATNITDTEPLATQGAGKQGHPHLQPGELSEKVRTLLELRKLELKESKAFTSTGKQLSELKSIVDQFMAVIRVAGEIQKTMAQLPAPATAGNARL